MKKSWRWKRNCLIAVWLISIFAIIAVYYRTEKRAALGKAEKNLIVQGKTVGGQIPSIIHNVLYSEVAMLKIQSAKLDAISLALEHIDDHVEAGEMIEQLSEAAGVDDLTVYDDKGNLIYFSGDSPVDCVGFETIRDVDYDYLNMVETMLAYPELYINHFFSANTITKEADETAEGTYEGTYEETYEGAAEETAGEIDDILAVRRVNGGRWLLASRINKIMTEKESMLIQRFDWRYIFREIRVGQDGFLAVFDNQDGTVLSFGQQDDMIARPLEEINIRIAGADHAASVQDLQEAFLTPDRVVPVRIGEREYDAVRINVDGTMILALQPLDVIYRDIHNSLISMLIPLFLLTGACVLFTVFHLQEEYEISGKPGRGFSWNKTIGNALTVFAVLSGTALFLFSLFLGNLLRYADTFRFTSGKVVGAVEMYSNNLDALKELENWSSEEYLTRCRIAETILEPLQPEDISSEYLQELAESLGVEYIYLFDINGNLVVTNSPYAHISIDRSNPFYALLESRPEMSGKPERDASSEKYLQKAGISLRTEDGKCSGLLMTEGYVEEIYEIAENLDYGHLFQQLCLSDGASVMVINSSDDKIEYTAHIQDGIYRSGLASFDYSGYPASETGLNTEKLYDNFNGSLTVLHENFFASIRRVEGLFFIIMANYPRINSDCARRAFMLTLTLLVFIVLVKIISCPLRTTGESDRETSHGDGKAVDVQRRSSDNSKKGFEERWRKDCIRWNDRTADDKIRASIRIIFILAFILVLINMGIAGENSVWNYVFSAERDKGINLPSVSACFVSVALLIVLKVALHKLLFLTARALDRKTETLCMLLDSFSGYVLVVFVIFTSLSHLGVDIRALSLTAGVAGVVFSLGCQNIVADIISGILMIFDGVICVGDFLFYNNSPYLVHAISIRTTKLKWFGNILVVRNNDLKNFVCKPDNLEDRVEVVLGIDVKESLKRIEDIFEREIEQIHEKMCAVTGENIRGPVYKGAKKISGNGMELSFVYYCKGMHYEKLRALLNRELKLICEQYDIEICTPSVKLSTSDQPNDKERQT